MCTFDILFIYSLQHVIAYFPAPNIYDVFSFLSAFIYILTNASLINAHIRHLPDTAATLYNKVYIGYICVGVHSKNKL